MPKVIVFWTSGGYEMQVEQLNVTARRISVVTSVFQLT
jgi:hypothetical protein